MTTARDDLTDFTAFAKDCIASGPSDLGLPELFDLWLHQKRGDTDFANNVTAINASFKDFMSGERGTRAGEHSRELREQYGL